MGLRYYLETYGCSLNAADSDIIVGRLNALEGQRVQDIDEAELILLNTCGVKEPTEDKIVHRLEELAKGTTPIVVAGCLPKISLDRVERAIPEYAALLGPQSMETLADIIPRILDGERGIRHIEADGAYKLKWFAGPPDSVICTIPICEGCLGSCAYCAVRFARGQVKSYSIKDLRELVERCVHLGYREIRLTSQDAAVYGTDTGEKLEDLMLSVNEIEGPHRFRLGMFNPNIVMSSIDRLLEAMDNEHFFKFFHIPLQSGSDKLLKTMKRRYIASDWVSVVEKVRKRFKNATIATDIIVGFPGENESDFQHTLELIQRVRPSITNISKYGDRPNTLASQSKDKVETSVKKQRSRKLTKIVDEILIESNKAWVGWSGPVLITEKGSKGGMLGRNEAYKIVIVQEDLSPGTMVDVEITSSERTHLIGEIRT
ncbi:MAG: tRNA (N(6)-L-threonylcarbamoyladenosine(37)-C(2))-methylthiotransferase [Candidatus Thorarchaeota archaeon]|nr:tRNA (N(6)-L-threonylcarbamoyladenosine(37)-C(2))-methylthiotransferase [Candidatus Thorarchaeota archaeon]